MSRSPGLASSIRSECRGSPTRSRRRCARGGPGMERNRLQRVFRVSWPRLVAIGLLVGIWQLLVVVGVKSGGTAGAGEALPGPGDAIAEISYLIHIGVLVPALLQTLERAAIGYALALVMGSVIGLAVVRIPVL